MDPTMVPGTRFESQFQICVYEHAILRIYISFFSNITCSLFRRFYHLEVIEYLDLDYMRCIDTRKPIFG